MQANTMKFRLLVARPAAGLLTNLKSPNDSYWPGATHCRIFTLLMSLKRDLKRVTFKKGPYFNCKNTIKVRPYCFTGVIGFLRPSAAQRMVSCLFLLKSNSNLAWVEGPWRAPCKLKKPFNGRGLRNGSCWMERKRWIFFQGIAFHKNQSF